MTPDHGQESDAAGAETGETANDGDSVSVDTIPDDGGELPVDSNAAEAALGRARFVSDLLDEAVRIPGTDVRVGLDPVLGVVSGYGDAVAAAISLYPVLEGYRLGVPRRTLAKMLSLVAVDFAIGSIPVLGTVLDAVWKANAWNVRTLERHVEGS